MKVKLKDKFTLQTIKVVDKKMGAVSLGDMSILATRVCGRYIGPHFFLPSIAMMKNNYPVFAEKYGYLPPTLTEEGFKQKESYFLGQRHGVLKYGQVVETEYVCSRFRQGTNQRFFELSINGRSMGVFNEVFLAKSRTENNVFELPRLFLDEPEVETVDIEDTIDFEAEMEAAAIKKMKETVAMRAAGGKFFAKNAPMQREYFEPLAETDMNQYMDRLMEDLSK